MYLQYLKVYLPACFYLKFRILISGVSSNSQCHCSLRNFALIIIINMMSIKRWLYIYETFSSQKFGNKTGRLINVSSSFNSRVCITMNAKKFYMEQQHGGILNVLNVLLLHSRYCSNPWQHNGESRAQPLALLVFPDSHFSKYSCGKLKIIFVQWDASRITSTQRLPIVIRICETMKRNMH